jgi:putative redox protein
VSGAPGDLNMDAKVVWKGRMSFDGSADTGFVVPLGADPAVGGDKDGFEPIEFLGIGLAGCTAMDVISILQKKRQDITGFEVRVHADQSAEHPKVFTRAVIEYHVTGRSVDEAAVVRAIELSATKYCPSQAMFTRVFPMELVYIIYETSVPAPVKQGTYVPTNGAVS